jgi:hypothetical protein
VCGGGQGGGACVSVCRALLCSCDAKLKVFTIPCLSMNP